MAWSGQVLMCALVLAACSCSTAHRSERKDAVFDVKQFTDMMEDHLEVFGTPGNPGYRNASHRDAWLNSREHIIAEFKRIGLETELQCFSTHLGEEEVTGCNVIGVSPGEFLKDRLIVGAHYDSLGSSATDDPRAALRENGAGVATLIEVARAYELSARWRGFRRDSPTIFVAFDLATMEKAGAAGARSGAHHFVESWLPAHASLEVFPPRGAFVLDSISTYNSERYSQRALPSDLFSVFPEGYRQIVADRQRGNFLAAVTTADGAWMCHDFAKHFQAEPALKCCKKKKARKEHKQRGAQKKTPFRLQELVAAQEGLGGGASYDAFVTADTRPFWQGVGGVAMPTVLLTDLGAPRSRVLAPEEKCAPSCPPFASPRTMAFLHETYSALTRTLLDRQTTPLDIPISGGSALSVSLMLLTAPLLTLLTGQ